MKVGGPFLVYLFLATTGASAWADVTPTVSPSPSFDDKSIAEIQGEVAKACNSTFSNPTYENGSPSQRVQYCQAAKEAYEGVLAQRNLAYTWGALAGVCATACLASLALPIGQYTQVGCITANISTGIADAAISKQFMNMMMVLGSAGGAYMMNRSMAPQKPAETGNLAGAEKGDVEKAGEKAPKQKDIGSCIIAASAAIQAFMKTSSITAMKGAVESALKNIKTLDSTAQAAAVNSGVNLNSATAGSFSPGTSTSSSGTVGATAPGITSPSTFRQCGSMLGGLSGFGTTSSFGGGFTSGINPLALTQCAVAMDPNLPRDIASPRFADDFKTGTGMNLGDFLNSNKSVGDSIVASASGGLTPEGVGKLRAAVQTIEQGLNINVSSSAYQGGGRATASQGGTDEFSALMGGFLQQFGPKGTAEDPNRGLKEVIYANQTRNISAIPQDPKLSLFDRITYRYYYVSRTLLPMGEKTGDSYEKK